MYETVSDLDIGNTRLGILKKKYLETLDWLSLVFSLNDALPLAGATRFITRARNSMHARTHLG